MKYNITINKTAHYHTIGNNNAQTIWFVLHGYGYLAEYFIKKFNPIASKNTLIVAPEGLSKFYTDGVGYDGRTGASWMTKDDREDEIKDYVNYLNQLYQVILKDNPNAKVNVVGFSQGGATASRWIANGKSKCDNFILWASIFPEDMKLKEISETTNTFVLFGDDDKYINEKQIADYEASLSTVNFNCKLIKFKGKHDIPEDVLVKQTEVNGW